MSPIPVDTHSSWEIGSNKTYPKLETDIIADVVIVGAGIAGIFSAYVLSQAGLDVVVLEKNENILTEATLYTTAFLTKLIDTPLSELISLYGLEKAKLVWQSGQESIEFIADIVKKENIACDFQFSSIFTYAKNEKEFALLTEEYTSIKKSGFVAKLSQGDKALGFENSGFLEIPQQAKFHPIKFANALAQIAESSGVRIFCNSEVTAIENQMKSMVAKTKNGGVTAKNIIISTYYPLTQEGTRFKKGMYTSYVYEVEISKGLILEGMYLDMQSPYHYFRIDSGNLFDRMIVGGEDHRADLHMNPEKNFHALETYIQSILHGNMYTIQRKWQGSILEPSDGLPLIGEIKPNTFVTTAFSGNGMTFSAVAATIMRDILQKNTNKYIALYNPKRISTLKQLFVKGFDYAKEFFGGAFKNW